MIRKIGIISRCDRDEILSHVEKIIDHVKSRVDVMIDPKTAERLHLKGTQIAEMRKNGAEFIISIGGMVRFCAGYRKWMIRFRSWALIWELLVFLWMCLRKILSLSLIKCCQVLRLRNALACQFL